VSIADTDNFVPAERQSWLVSARYSVAANSSHYTATPTVHHRARVVFTRLPLFWNQEMFGNSAKVGKKAKSRGEVREFV